MKGAARAPEPDATSELFAGTAWYYARFRPRYPRELIDSVVTSLRLDGTGQLLDLGCGTGALARALAPHVAGVTGVDPEPEMLAEAAELAAREGIRNIRWLRGTAADLPHLYRQAGLFHAVTVGDAFHWMDRDATLRALDALVAPAGGVALATNGGSIWSGGASWHRVTREVIQRWLGPERRAGAGGYTPPPDRFEDSLARSPFRHTSTRRFSIERAWDLDRLVGLLYSTSFCSPRVLGNRREAFETDLRASLLALDPRGVYREVVAPEVWLGRRALPARELGLPGRD